MTKYSSPTKREPPTCSGPGKNTCFDMKKLSLNLYLNGSRFIGSKSLLELPGPDPFFITLISYNMNFTLRKIFVLAFLLVTLSSWGSDFRVGIARKSITPQFPIWLNGYAAREKPSEGKSHDLWVKALVIAVLIWIFATVIGYFLPTLSGPL